MRAHAPFGGSLQKLEHSASLQYLDDARHVVFLAVGFDAIVLRSNKCIMEREFQSLNADALVIAEG